MTDTTAKTTSHHTGRHHLSNAHTIDYTPLHWNDYYDAQHYITLPNQLTCCYYTCGNATNNQGELVYVLVHGAGQSALSFALVAARLKQLCPHSVIAIDCRHHGHTTLSTGDRQQYDLSMSTLVTDAVQCMTQLLDPATPVVLVGHSMGASIAVNTAHHCQTHSTPLSIRGCIVIDLVETTALASIDHITQCMQNRPKCFATVTEAVEWSVRSDVVRNVTSARVSVPDQLQHNSGGYDWVTDLTLTAGYWREWFEHLSERLLSLKCSKLLIVANTDRLDDKTLLVGQMQGKLQVECIRDTTHAVQEDKPDAVARLLLAFVRRHVQR